MQLIQLEAAPALDDLTQLACALCDAPVSLVSIVDKDQVWFKSGVGLHATHAERQHAFCGYVVDSAAPLVVEDASADSRFSHPAWVQSVPGVRFYAGIPLALHSGIVVGSMCVLDYHPRTLSPAQLGNLQRLARQVVALLEARYAQQQLVLLEKNRLVSEQRLDFALAAADIGDWEMDLRTNVARRSLLHDQAFGYTEGVAKWGYDTFLAHIHTADRARVDLCYQRAMAGEGAYDVEFRVVWPDQAVRWLWSKGRFYFDEHGQPDRVAGIVVNITERKKSEEDLRASEHRWRFAIEGSGDGLWDWNIPGNQVYYSDRWKAILGVAPEDHASDPSVWESRLHPDDKERVFAAVQAHLDGATPYFTNEHRVRCSDGSTKWVLGRGLVVQRDDSGKPLRMIGTNADITERKRAESALRESEARRKIATDSGRVAVWETSLTSDRVIWDDNCFALYRKSKDAFNGTFAEWAQVIHPEDRAAEEAAFQAAVEGTKDYDLTFRIVWPDGSVRFIQARGEVVLGEDGLPERVIGTNWDVTGQKQYEEELRALLADKGALLNEVHHRVKNNLQVITSLLRLEVARSTSAETRAILGDMKGRIYAMAQLHESLHRAGIFANVDLGTYLGRLATRAFESSALQGSAVRLALQLGALRLGIDQANAAGLVLNELISNCLKHGFPHGRVGEIKVELQPVGTHQPSQDQLWCLRVSDTGVGLPHDFERRREASLGLQLISGLCSQLGGTLVVESVPGAGASFSVGFTAHIPAPLGLP